MPALLRLLADSDPIRFHNPQAARGGFLFHERKGAPHYGQRVLDALRLGAQNPDAAMARRWVCPYVGEVQIQRDQHAIFAPACIEDRRVRLASQSLVVHGVSVVTRTEQERLRIAR